MAPLALILALGVGPTQDAQAAEPKGPPFQGLQNQIAALDGTVLRAWSRKIEDATARFVVLESFGAEAVLDLETQLVWQRTPDATRRAWVTAMSACLNSQIGGRGGWRMPQMEEVTTLVDRTQGSPPLPVGHPFNLANLSGDVWSATTVPDTDTAWTQDVRNDGFLGGFPKDAALNVWCVRGGRGVEGQ